MDKMKRKIEVEEEIELGDVGLDPDVYNTKNAKVRITAYLDGDVYEELNKRANAGAGKGRYQTLMNELLKKSLFAETLSSKSLEVPPPKTLAEIELFIQKIVKREMNQVIDLKTRVSKETLSTKKRSAGR